MSITGTEHHSVTRDKESIGQTTMAPPPLAVAKSTQRIAKLASPICQLSSEVWAEILKHDARINPAWAYDDHLYTSFQRRWVQYVEHWTAVYPTLLSIAKTAFMYARTCAMNVRCLSPWKLGSPLRGVQRRRVALSLLQDVEVEVDITRCLSSDFAPIINKLPRLKQLHVVLWSDHRLYELASPGTLMTRTNPFNSVEEHLQRASPSSLHVTMDFHVSQIHEKIELSSDLPADMRYLPYRLDYDMTYDHPYKPSPRRLTIHPSQSRSYLERVNPRRMLLSEMKMTLIANADDMADFKEVLGFSCSPWEIIDEPGEELSLDVCRAVEKGQFQDHPLDLLLRNIMAKQDEERKRQREIQLQKMKEEEYEK